jgi:hypothetical protein
MQLNKQEKGEKVMNSEWVKSSYELMDGIRMGIDQVSVTIPYIPLAHPAGELDQEQLKQLITAQKQHWNEAISNINYVRWTVQNIFKAAPPKLVKGLKTLHRIKVFCEEDASHIATITLGLFFGKPLINYSFNPSKLTAEGSMELEALLALTHMMGYEGIYSGGFIARLEFFLDVEDVPNSDLVLLDTGKRKTTLYKDTTYHGRRGRKLVGTSYDKAAQQKIDRVLTRIEARIKRRDKTLQDVVEGGIANPFSPFIVVPASALDLVAGEWPNCPELAHQIRQYGLYGGIKNQPARKGITKRLQQLAVPWWNADAIWAKFGTIMEGFRPAFIGGIADY